MDMYMLMMTVNC